jgi:hypothetical protein
VFSHFVFGNCSAVLNNLKLVIKSYDVRMFATDIGCRLVEVPRQLNTRSGTYRDDLHTSMSEFPFLEVQTVKNAILEELARIATGGTRPWSKLSAKDQERTVELVKAAIREIVQPAGRVATKETGRPRKPDMPE